MNNVSTNNRNTTLIIIGTVVVVLLLVLVFGNRMMTGDMMVSDRLFRPTLAAARLLRLSAAALSA